MFKKVRSSLSGGKKCYVRIHQNAQINSVKFAQIPRINNQHSAKYPSYKTLPQNKTTDCSKINLIVTKINLLILFC